MQFFRIFTSPLSLVIALGSCVAAPKPPNLDELGSTQFEYDIAAPTPPDRAAPQWQSEAAPDRLELDLPKWERVWLDKVAATGEDFHAIGRADSIPEALGKCAFIFVPEQSKVERAALINGAIGAGIVPMDLGAFSGSDFEWASGARRREAAALAQALMALEVDLDALAGFVQSLKLDQADSEWRYLDLTLNSPVSSWVQAHPWSPLEPDSVCVVHLANQSAREVELALYDLDARLGELTAHSEAIDRYNAAASEFNAQMDQLQGDWDAYYEEWDSWNRRRREAYLNQKDAFDARVAQLKAADDLAWEEYGAKRKKAPLGRAQVRVEVEYPTWEDLPDVQRFEAPPILQGSDWRKILVQFQTFEDELRANAEAVVTCIDTRIVAEFISAQDGVVLGTVDVRWTVPTQFADLPTSLFSAAMRRALTD